MAVATLLPGISSARPTNGTINKVNSEDQAAHRWYRFVLSFPPHLVRDYLTRFGASADNLVLDPFCGTGTTLVEAKKLGIPSVGIEAHPMSQFAASVKLDWAVDPDDLLAHAKGIARATRKALSQDGLQDEGDDHVSPKDAKSLLRLTPESEKLILKDSISPLPLHKTLRLLRQIEERHDPRFCRHELLALARAVVFSTSNLHFGPEVGVQKIKNDAEVLRSWLAEVTAVAEDLRQLRTRNNVAATVYRCDSRQSLVSLLGPASVDFVITSPPYPNEKDYTRTTRLESVLLGFIKDKAQLQGFKKQLVRSNTRSVYKADLDDEFVRGFPEIQRLAIDIEKRRIELKKTSGFERLYARVTKLYFGGMARHLQQLKKVLRPGAQLAYVVGDQASYLRVMIRTGQILGEIADSLGYEVVRIDLFRTRLATVTREQLREEVVILRYRGHSTE